MWDPCLADFSDHHCFALSHRPHSPLFLLSTFKKISSIRRTNKIIKRETKLGFALFCLLFFFYFSLKNNGGVLLIESIKWWCTSPKRGHVDLRRGAKQRHVFSVIIEDKTTQRQEGALTIKLMSADRIVCGYRGGGFRLVLFVSLFFSPYVSQHTITQDGDDQTTSTTTDDTKR